MDFGVVDLSRIQFAATALYHFLFVPLTLGLSVLVATMETVYVMTGRPIWRQMTKFWGTLFAINFVLGVGTGLTMEFEFGMNWSYYSHYIGDIFGAPLAIEGLMAFFLEATFVGLFFFGWDRMKPLPHLITAWMVAIGSNLSALWILIANGWMQNPVGASFNPESMRIEMTSFFEVLFNPVAMAKFVHTVSAGYCTAAFFVLGVSCWYMLKGRHTALARRSIAVATAFGLAASISVIVLGDESGYDISENQKMKMAAIESMWDTEPAPAPFTLIGLPSNKDEKTKFAIKIPWVMGLIGTRSLTDEIPGIKDLVAQNEDRIRHGLIAYDALQTIQADKNNAPADVMRAFNEHSNDLGYALLLKKYVADPRTATDQQIQAAAWDTVPTVWPVFFGFRIMVLMSVIMLITMIYMFYRSSFRGSFPRWALRLGVIVLPAPWIAVECGWIVAEYGRQPWTADGILPTFLSASNLSVQDLVITLALFIILYTTLFIIEMGLMLKYIKKGPYLEVEETDEWMRRHEARLKGVKLPSDDTLVNAAPAE